MRKDFIYFVNYFHKVHRIPALKFRCSPLGYIEKQAAVSIEIINYFFFTYTDI